MEKRSSINRRKIDRRNGHIGADQLLKNGRAALEEIKLNYPNLKSAHNDLLNEVKHYDIQISNLSEKLGRSTDFGWKERATKSMYHMERERDVINILIKETEDLRVKCDQYDHQDNDISKLFMQQAKLLLSEKTFNQILESVQKKSN